MSKELITVTVEIKMELECNPDDVREYMEDWIYDHALDEEQVEYDYEIVDRFWYDEE